MDTKSQQALSGSNDGLLKKWDMNRVTCTMNLHGGWGELRCLAVDWPGEQAISGSEMGVLKHWDLLECVCLRRMQNESIGLFDGIFSIQLDWSTANALTGGASGQVKLWHLGKAPCLLAEHTHCVEVRCVSINACEPEPMEDGESSQNASQNGSDVEGDLAEALSPPSAMPSHTQLSPASSNGMLPPPLCSGASPFSQDTEAALQQEHRLREYPRRRCWMAVTVGLVVIGAVGIALRRRWRRR